MKHHKLKIEQRYYDALHCGDKPYELRYNDRDYQAGDTISFDVQWADEILCENHLKEAARAKYLITHVLHYPQGLKQGWVILSLTKETHERA